MLFGFLLTRGDLPVLEGITHLVGIPLMIVWSIRLRRYAQTDAEKRCITLHTCGMISTYAVSAALHSAFWSIEDVLFRLDQSMIFIAVVVTLFPITILLLQDRYQRYITRLLKVTTIIGIMLSLFGFTQRVGVPTASVSFATVMAGETIVLIIAVWKTKTLPLEGYLIMVSIGLIYLFGVWINTQGWLTIPRIVDNNELFHVCTLIAEWIYIRFFRKYLLSKQYQFAIPSGA